jgi:uncharacterized protein YbjT (DUF2867 family)
MVFVVGGSGLVGNEVCRRLIARGEPVKALVRETSSSEKLESLRSLGVELCTGDLKDPDSIAAACRGADSVISTASSTLSRQPGDSIQSVDRDGQLNLVSAARAARVDRFVFVSFRRTPAITSPLAEAKEQIERAIEDLNFTVIQASWFMEVWLTPALGFDAANATARIYGDGTSPVSWVSSRDVAEMCVVALRHPAAERQIIEFGGPQALSPLQVVERFEKIGGRRFRLEHVPERMLIEQWERAADPMQKTFAALMLAYARGDKMEMEPVIDTFGLQLASVDDYARSVLGKRRPLQFEGEGGAPGFQT